MEHPNESFSYTYSSKQQEEVKRIRQRYLPPEENKLEQLRRLDASVGRPGTAAALLVGGIGSLLFGLGLCCATLWTQYFAPGVVVGIAGLAVMGAAYPLCTAITKRQRKKLAPRVMELSRELMAEE